MRDDDADEPGSADHSFALASGVASRQYQLVADVAPEHRGPLIFDPQHLWLRRGRPTDEADLAVRLGVGPHSVGDSIVLAMSVLLGTLAVLAAGSGAEPDRGLLAAVLLWLLGAYCLRAGWSGQRLGWSHRDRWLLLFGEVVIGASALAGAVSAVRLVSA